MANPSGVRSRSNDLKYAVNTNWDLFQHGTTNKLYLRNNDTWLMASDLNGAWSPAGKLPESFTKLPAEDNWKDVKANLPGKSDQGVRGAQGVRQPAAGGTDSPHRRAQLSAGPDESPVGQQHGERRVPHGEERTRLLPRRGPLVLGARLHRALDVRLAVTARGFQEDPARARSLSRARVRARHRSGRRGRAARADSADCARQQEGSEGSRGCVPGRAAVCADRDRRPSRVR